MIPRRLLLLLMLAFTCAATAELAHDLQPPNADSLWSTTNSRLEVDGDIYRWHLQPGQAAELAIRQDHPLMRQLRYVDYANVELRIASGEVSGMNLKVLGHVSGPRQYKVHDWQVAILTTQKQTWLRRSFELARPNWFPWDSPDGQGTDAFFRFSAVGLSPDTVIEFRGMQLTRALVRLKPDYLPPITWPLLSRDTDGTATYTLTHHLVNQANQPVDIEAEITSVHQRFAVSLEQSLRENIKNGKTTTFTVNATMSQADEAAVPDLYSEPLTLVFRPAHAPDAAITWEGRLVRPLSDAVNRQVLLKPDDLTFLRETLADDERLADLIKPQAAIAAADTFLTKELLRIPTGHLHVSNNWVGPWRPADRMPEAINTETGETQFDTAIAARTWKEYMAHRGGAMEALAHAYLFTANEAYAEKAIELFRLYAQQYTDLSWDDFFSPPFSQGGTILSSTRVALSSTYGTNWYFKGHSRLLSAIADSPSWTDEVRQHVYRNFALPYVTELTKFHGGISNMTDITNHNVLLMGLAFRDATMVHWALYSDAGLLRRLEDITPDGFSSEGRPLNYHYAAMSEYMPALAFLDNARLTADFPRERLAAALRMPYQRASLGGTVPSTGDIARGMRVGKRGEADWLIGMFPDERWLFELGNMSTLQAQLHAYRTNSKPDPNGWQSLLESEPRLFEHAGYAILRQGKTADEQIMATLDFGRNPMHAHLDRNTISLIAFGHLYTHGPGSMYNVGSGGMTRNQELNPLVTSASIAQNVILVDQQDQLPAVGSLVHWDIGQERQLVIGRVPAIRPGVDHLRAMILQDGIITIVDKVISNDQHSYDFVYHNFGELSLGEGWQATALDQPLGTSASYEALLNPQRLTGDGPVRLDWAVIDGANLALWAIPGGDVYTVTSAMNNPQTRIIPQPAPTLIHRKHGNTVTWITVLEPYRETPRVTGVTATGPVALRIDLTGNQTLEYDLAPWLD